MFGDKLDLYEVDEFHLNWGGTSLLALYITVVAKQVFKLSLRGNSTRAWSVWFRKGRRGSFSELSSKGVAEHGGQGKEVWGSHLWKLKDCRKGQPHSIFGKVHYVQVLICKYKKAKWEAWVLSVKWGHRYNGYNRNVEKWGKFLGYSYPWIQAYRKKELSLSFCPCP